MLLRLLEQKSKKYKKRFLLVDFFRYIFYVCSCHTQLMIKHEIPHDWIKICWSQENTKFAFLLPGFLKICCFSFKYLLILNLVTIVMKWFYYLWNKVWFVKQMIVHPHKKDDPLTMLNNYTHIKVCFKRNCARIVKKLKVNLCGAGAGGCSFTMVKHKL